MKAINNRRFALYTSDGKASRPRTLKNGVSQGSILVPCLLNIFISDMPKTESHQFADADYLAILCCKPSWNSALTMMNNDLDILYSYYHENRFHLNLEKTS